MKIEDLPTTVQRLWEVTIPPLAHAALLFLVAWVIIGPAQAAMILGGFATGNSLLPSQELQKALTFWGLNKALPLVATITVFVCAYGLTQITVWLGGVVPLTFRPIPGLAFVKYSPSVEDLREIWEYYPLQNTIYELDRAIDADVSAVGEAIPPDDSLKRVRELYARREEQAKRVNFVKGLLLLAVVMTILGVWLPYAPGLIVRALLVFTVLVGAFVAFAAAEICTYREFTNEKVKAFKEYRKKNRIDAPQPDNNQKEARVARIASLLNETRSKGVWRLELRTSVNWDDAHQLLKASIGWRASNRDQQEPQLPPGPARAA